MTLENGSQGASPLWKNNAASSSPDSAKPTSTQRDGATFQDAKKTRAPRETMWRERQRHVAPVPPSGGGGERDLNFFDVLGILKRQIWIVALMTIIGGALAVYRYTTTPKEYESSAEIYFPSASASALIRSYDNSRNAGDQSKIDNIETLSTVLLSDAILAPVGDALLGRYRAEVPNLYEAFERQIEMNARLAAERQAATSNAASEDGDASSREEATVAVADVETPSNQSEDAKARRREKAAVVGLLRKMLSVKKGGNGRDFEEANVIVVSCVALDPEEAQTIVQVVVD
ncbi:MAG: hypothetical protein IJY15_04655, partial [Thermoguttaceae bacterium]|nr:hypothetical protein [Thermoguttaceae bacterium]